MAKNPAKDQAGESDIARFATLHNERRDREKQQRRREAEAKEAERQARDTEQAEQRRLEDARRAKQDAAQRLKQLRSRGAKAAEVADAELAYKTALARLIAVETGARPEWAGDEPEADQEASEQPITDATDATDEAATDEAQNEAAVETGGPVSES